MQRQTTLFEKVETLLDQVIFSRGHDEVLMEPVSKIASDLQILEPGLGFYSHEEVTSAVAQYMEGV